MPKYPKEDDAAREARSALAAANLTKAADYDVTQDAVLLPPPLSSGYLVAAAGLVIITTGDYFRAGLVEALHEVRTDVLVVAAGATTSGAWATYFTLLLCRSGEIEGYGPLRLWAGAGERLHLVPDPAGCDPATPCFRLDPLRLVPIPAPWPDFLGRKGGLDRAELLLHGELSEGL
jgi:hypothetical protein